MAIPDQQLAARVAHLRHPTAMTLGDAARRLGVSEGRVAEALCEQGPVLPGAAVRVTRLAPEPGRLLEALLGGGPLAIGVGGDAAVGGWRVATAVHVTIDRPALRIRWDGAELVLPSDGLHAYAIRESTGCRCGERRLVAWYDAAGRPLARATQRMDADPAAYAACVGQLTEERPTCWADPPPSAPAGLYDGRCTLAAMSLGALLAELQAAADMPPLSVIVGRRRYLLVQHAPAWRACGGGRVHRLCDGPGWIHACQDGIGSLAIVEVPAPGALHAVEVVDDAGERQLAILPQHAPDGCDPPGWARLMRRWQAAAH